jgi:uncharacterized membrane protein
MKKFLLALNHGYYFWGTSIYLGLLWSLHFIFYPSWVSISPESVEAHFMVPVNAATAFFTVVVPPMLFAGLVMICSEWKNGKKYTSIAAYVSLLTMMGVGYFLIRPVNEAIAKGIEEKTLVATQLNTQLSDWMLYNDMRLVIMTLMWFILLFYFFRKNT